MGEVLRGVEFREGSLVGGMSLPVGLRWGLLRCVRYGAVGAVGEVLRGGRFSVGWIFGGCHCWL